jgi:hypothetical protein
MEENTPTETATGTAGGMLTCSTGSKWESFVGDSTEIVLGASSEYVTGLELSSKVAGIVDFNYGSTIEYTKLYKYEFIDIQGFMFDNLGLEYFGGSNSVVTSGGFVQTAGFNLGSEVYASCSSIINQLGNILLGFHTAVAAAGVSASITAWSGGVERSEEPSIVAANNIPLMASVAESMSAIGMVYFNLATQMKNIFSSELIQPQSVVYGHGGTLFTGTQSKTGGASTQIKQSNGIIQIGAQAAGTPIKQGAIYPAHPTYGFTPALADTSITLNSIAGAASIMTKSPTGLISETADTIVNDATTEYSVLSSGQPRVSVTAEEIGITIGASLITVLEDSVTIKLGGSTIEVLGSAVTVASGESGLTISPSSIAITSPSISINGSLKVNGSNVMVAP